MKYKALYFLIIGYLISGVIIYNYYSVPVEFSDWDAPLARLYIIISVISFDFAIVAMVMCIYNILKQKLSTNINLLITFFSFIEIVLSVFTFLVALYSFKENSPVLH